MRYLENVTKQRNFSSVSAKPKLSIPDIKWITGENFSLHLRNNRNEQTGVFHLLTNLSRNFMVKIVAWLIIHISLLFLVYHCLGGASGVQNTTMHFSHDQGTRKLRASHNLHGVGLCKKHNDISEKIFLPNYIVWLTMYLLHITLKTT